MTIDALASIFRLNGFRFTVVVPVPKARVMDVPRPVVAADNPSCACC